MLSLRASQPHPSSCTAKPIITTLPFFLSLGIACVWGALYITSPTPVVFYYLTSLHDYFLNSSLLHFALYPLSFSFFFPSLKYYHTQTQGTSHTHIHTHKQKLLLPFFKFLNSSLLNSGVCIFSLYGWILLVDNTR